MSDCDFYLDLSGSPRELGRAHGESLRPVIQAGIERWQNFLSETTSMRFDDLLARFLADTNYQPAIEKWAPHLADEVRGVAEGAGLDEDLIYAWQMVDEIIDYVIEYVYVEKCSTLGGYDQGDGLAPVLGKTQDLMHCYIGTAAVIRTRYADSEINILNSTVAGIICQDGISRTLGVCLNHVGQLDRSTNGLPVTFIARLMLEQCAGIDQAKGLLQKVTHASGMNYALADRQAVRTFEVSANHVEEFLPAPGLKRIWHTNHPLVNQNYCREILMWDRLPDTDAGNTIKRMDYLDREVPIAEKSLTVARVQEILSSREVPISHQQEDGFLSINSIVMEFSQKPILYFSPGPPSQHDYVSFSFD